MIEEHISREFRSTKIYGKTSLLNKLSKWNK